jgi:hypothetical protein
LVAPRCHRREGIGHECRRRQRGRRSCQCRHPPRTRIARARGNRRAAAPPEQEFDLLDDEPDIDAAKARALRSQIRLVARQASLDPGDGIEL